MVIMINIFIVVGLIVGSIVYYKRGEKSEPQSYSSEIPQSTVKTPNQYCTECGKPSEGTAFCVECGAKV